jgi:TRAP-type C4-dicarboxylate transport system substrate-binding protein
MMTMVQDLGASATPMAYGEVYTGLQSGVIDGAENNWPSYYTTSHYEVARYFTLDHHTRTPEVLCASKAVWDKLSPEDQKIIKEAAVESQKVQREAWAKLVEKAKKAIMATGKNTITEIKDVTPWQNAVKSLYTKMDLGPNRDKYIKEIAETK